MKKFVSLLLVFAMIFSSAISICAEISISNSSEMLDYLLKKIDEENAELWEAQKAEMAEKILEEAIARQNNSKEEEIVEVKNETIVFDNELYKGKTAEEIAKAKLMFCGFPEDLAEGIMSEAMIEIMSGETEAVKQTIYMKEVVTDDESELVVITEEEHNSRIAVATAEDDSDIFTNLTD